MTTVKERVITKRREGEVKVGRWEGFVMREFIDPQRWKGEFVLNRENYLPIWRIKTCQPRACPF